MAAELARLKASGGKVPATDPQVTQLRQQNQQLQAQCELLKRAGQTENQKATKNAQAESATLTQRITYLEGQNDNLANENESLRQAQIEMQERHTAEIIEIKQS